MKTCLRTKLLLIILGSFLIKTGCAIEPARLGNIHYAGEGVTQSFTEAMKLYRLAADQGNARAQNNLGYMYANGQGVAKDESEAVKWFRLAADQGYARAQDNLGYMYEKGEGVAKDESEAVKWYRLAADQGFAQASDNLILMESKQKNSKPAQPSPPTISKKKANVKPKQQIGELE